MAKKFKFEFERGGTLIADACEEAPVTVRLFEEQCPRTMEILQTYVWVKVRVIRKDL